VRIKQDGNDQNMYRYGKAGLMEDEGLFTVKAAPSK
jgi:hypothetical protein